MPTRLRACALLAIALTSSDPLPAAEEKALEDELRWLKAEAVTTRTASLVEESLTEAPATVVVVTRRQIEDRGYRSVLDLLHDLPGVDVQERAESFQTNRVALRGITGNSKFLILLDGVRINAATGTPSLPIEDNFPLYMAKQVEILYGPASAIYGADAFTGVINIITDRAATRDGWRVALSGGERSNVGALAEGGVALTENVGLSLGAHYHRSEDDLVDEFPSEYALDDLLTLGGQLFLPASERENWVGERKSHSAYGKLELGERVTLGFFESYFQAPTATGNYPDYTDYGPEAFGGTTLATVYGKYAFDLGEHGSGLLLADYSLYEIDPDTKFTNAFVDYLEGYKYEKGERFEIEPQATFEISSHLVSAGITLQRFTSIPFTADLSKPYDRGRDAGDQGVYYPGSNGKLPIQIYDIDYSNVGLFVQDKAEWTDRLSTTVGLRVDRSSDYGTTTNPRLGLVFEASARTTLKALYGEAFIAPSPLERYINFGSFFESSPGTFESYFFRVPNPDLEPEEVRTFEVSWIQALGDDLTLTVGAYRSEADDLILVAPTDPVQSDFVPGGTIYFTDSHQNVGELSATGVDVMVDYRHAFADARLDAWASVSYTDGDLDNRLTGVRVDLPFVSRTKAHAGVTWNRRDRLVVSPRITHVGKASSFIADPTSSEFGRKVPAYTLLDLHAEWRQPFQGSLDQLALVLDAWNLTDARYTNAGNGGTFDFFETPQPGRTVTVGVSLQF